MSAYKSIHGLFFGIDTESEKVQARNGFASGGNGVPEVEHPDANTFGLMHDFIGETDTGAPRGVEKVAGDTGVNHSGVSGAVGGVYRFTLGSTAAAAPASGGGINLGRCVELSGVGSRSRLTARIRATNFNDTGRRLALFVGFTDTGGAAQMPTYDTGAGFIAAATNAVGIFHGSRSDTGLSGVGIQAGTARSPVVLDTGGLSPGEWKTFEVEIGVNAGDTGGYAKFIVDGKKSGSITGPVARNIKLAPVVYAFQEDTGGGQVVDIDMIAVSGRRDTGI